MSRVGPDRVSIETVAGSLRQELAGVLAAQGSLNDSGWRRAVEVVPRHRFVPGFYLTGDQTEARTGLPIHEPVTGLLDPDRWLHEIYTNQTLITQYDEDEPDWNHPAPRVGGSPTSSSTLPSLVLRMWADADLDDGQDILEVGTGTGYSTALACERFGSTRVTSIEIDPHRLAQAGAALDGCGYAPRLAIADGRYGYWPGAPYDRIVAACSFRTIPDSWLAQARPGAKILTTLSGWLWGFGRVLLTVDGRGRAEGPLLPGTVSFMLARADSPPAFGTPAHWALLTRDAAPRAARHSPDRITDVTAEAFTARFLAQLAVPNAQMTSDDEGTHLVDITTGSVASLRPGRGGWTVRQAGPVRLWDSIETALTDWEHAGRPGTEEFWMVIDGAGRRIEHAAGMTFAQ